MLEHDVGGVSIDNYETTLPIGKGLSSSAAWLLGVGGVAAAYPALLLCCVLLTMGAAGLTIFLAPASAGSGIPMVKAELNGVRARVIDTC